MPEPMSEARLAEIEARVAAATPGSWSVSVKFKTVVDDIISQSGDHPVCLGHAYDDYGNIELSDAAFIAHARTDIPDLIAEVRRLRMENHGLRERVSQMERGPGTVYEDQRRAPSLSGVWLDDPFR